MWHSYVYKIHRDGSVLDIVDSFPIIKIGASGARLGPNYPHTTADPFLYPDKNDLYLFFERKGDFSKGEIHVGKIVDDGWVYLGLALREHFHISYPYVFSRAGKTYMLPETSEVGGLFLYEPDNFPFGWRVSRRLIPELLHDVNVFFLHDVVFLIGSNPESGLVVYSAIDLLGEFKRIYSAGIYDYESSRNAGPITRLGKSTYRLFQNNHRYYGEKVGVAKIGPIDDKSYSETIVSTDIFRERVPEHLKVGHHHVSTAMHKEFLYVAIDGLSYDCYLNTVLYGLIKIKMFFRV